MTEHLTDPVSRQPVLVVEDDQAIQRLIAATLRRENIPVVVASNGAEAIEKLAAESFAMLTLDLMMPEVSGWEVIEWLRRNPSRRAASVTVISAADESVFHKLDPTIVNAVFIKPFDVAALGAYIKATLGRTPDRRRRRVVSASFV